MLKILRKKGIAKKILWVLAFMITVSFVFWGMSSSLTPQDSVNFAGRIHGRKVSFEDFQKAFLHTRNQAIMRYGENFQKISQFLDLNTETWDRLILMREAEKRRIRVSDQDVVHAVRGLPFFQRDNRFDQALYHQIVQHVFQCRPRDFEEGIRQSLIFQEIYDEETATVVVSDQEALESYKKQNEKTQVDYISFLSQNYEKGLVVSDAEAQVYYGAHQNEFLMPSTINVSYLALEYPPEANDEQKDKIQEKIVRIASDLNDTKISLEEVAAKYDLPLKTSGFFSQEQPNMDLGWPLEIFQQALLLKPGETIGPIATLKGYYILKLKEQKDSYIPAFDAVKEKARKALIAKQAQALALEAARQALATITDMRTQDSQKAFPKIAQELNAEIQQTDFFTRAEYLPHIGPSAQFHEAAFALSVENPLSDIVETTNGYMILSLIALEPIDQEKYLEEKDVLKERLLAQKKDERFNAFLARLRLAADLQDNLKKLERAGRTF